MIKKIKSLIVAGLLVISMSGAAFADTAVSNGVYVNIGGVAQDEIIYSVDENSIKGYVLNVSGLSGHPENTYYVEFTWDEEKVTAIGSEVTYIIDGEEQYIPLDFGSGIANKTFTLPVGSTIKAIDLGYDLIDVGGTEPEQQPPVSFDNAEQKVINNYRESMKTVGVLNNGERQIDTSFMIEKEAWNDFVADVNAADNYVMINAKNAENYMTKCRVNVIMIPKRSFWKLIYAIIVANIRFYMGTTVWNV